MFVTVVKFWAAVGTSLGSSRRDLGLGRSKGLLLKREPKLAGWIPSDLPNSSHEAFLKAPAKSQELVLIGLLLHRVRLCSVPHLDRPSEFAALLAGTESGTTGIIAKPPSQPPLDLRPAAAAAEPAESGGDNSPELYERFLQLLDDIGWSEGNIDAGVLSTVRTAPRIQQSWLLDALEERDVGCQGFLGIERWQRTSFIANLLSRARRGAAEIQGSNSGQAPAVLLAAEDLGSAQEQLESMFGSNLLDRQTLHPLHLSKQVVHAASKKN